jgi:sugar diacid utilization regulator
VDSDDDSPPQKKEKKAELQRQQAKSCVPALAGASTFFHDQRVGAKGIRSKIKEAENAELLHISHQQFSAFMDLAAVADPNNDFLEKLNSDHRKELHRLAWLLLSDNNVLLYGIGNKRPLIKELVESFLEGEDVLEVGLPSYNTIAPVEQQMVKSLLEHIEKVVLKNRFVDTLTLSWPKRAELVAGKCYFLAVPVGSVSNM